MFRGNEIDEDSVNIIYESPAAVLLTSLKNTGVGLEWKPWKPRFIEVREDGTLLWRSKSKEPPIKGKISLSKVCNVSVVSLEAALPSTISGSLNPLIAKEVGLNITGQSIADGKEATIRSIFLENELEHLFAAIRRVAVNHNLDTMTRHMPTHQANVMNPLTSKVGLSPSLFVRNQSVFRKLLAKTWDKYDTITNKEQILARRGSMKWLPVLFQNDLVHGSWWFVIGSLSVILFSSIVLANDFTIILGEDDSLLSKFHYRATWELLILSGVFFTLGSLAFVRCLHENPPMDPLFKGCFHLSTDELLGSWLFFLGSLPFIPYSLVYVADEPNKILYFGAFVVSVFIVLGTLLFVRASYPSEKPNSRYILPIALCTLQCCCSETFLKKHLANDWLAGCWVFFWGTLVATIACIVLSANAIANKDSLLIFIYVTAAIENFFFLIGAAYWVSGSYPENMEEEEEGDDEGDEGYLYTNEGAGRCEAMSGGGALFNSHNSHNSHNSQARGGVGISSIVPFSQQEDYVLIVDSTHSPTTTVSRSIAPDTITI